MKKLIVIFIILSALFLLLTPTWKNIVGGIMGYGKCPNCENSFFWKEKEWISYGFDGAGFYLPTGTLPFCKKDITHPLELNENRIRKNLRRSGWDERSINMILASIGAYIS